jgi:hypothetical protein
MKALRHLFRPSIVDDDGDPVPFIWVGDDNDSAYLSRDTGRVIAFIWHDGCGKFYPTIYVSLFEACRILRREPVIHFGLRSFPRCALDLLRFKCASMSDALEAFEELLADLRII